MGFERLCMVLQGVQSNYDTDVFTPLIREIETITNKSYGGDEKKSLMLQFVLFQTTFVPLRFPLQMDNYQVIPELVMWFEEFYVVPCVMGLPFWIKKNRSFIDWLVY